MINIQSQSHTYTVETVDTLKDALRKSQDGAQVYYLIDDNVFQLYLQEFEDLDKTKIITLTANEHQKSYGKLESIFTKLIQYGFQKNSKLVVIGGGILQDIGCFICSIFNRGVKWDLIPTTLLSQCDSCIGGKSSINIGVYKNQLGTFYPPNKITICFSILKTLPPDEIRSGIGEIIKIGLVASPDLFELTRKTLLIYNQDPINLKDLILQSLQVKKTFIEKDEFDKAERNLLNYGHTFGHAYESATHFQIPHGIAVLIGISTASYFSERLGKTPVGFFNKIDDWIYPFYTPFQKKLEHVSIETILAAIKTDKKNNNGKITCILPKKIGETEKVPLDLTQEFAPLLKEYFDRKILFT